MATKAQVLELLTAAKGYYIDKEAEKLASLKQGSSSNCKGCCDKGMSCLLLVLEPLQWQYDFNVFNGTTDILYLAVLAIVGNSYIPVPGTPTLQFTYSDTDLSETLEDIDFLFSQDYDGAATSITVDFTQSGNQKFFYIKMPHNPLAFSHWGNLTPNEGDIPDFVWGFTTIDDFDYYYTRATFSLNATNSTITLSK